MASPLEELRTRLGELQADLDFVALAVQLRPRIGDVVNWQAGAEVLELAKTFMQAKSTRPEGVYGPLLMRLLGVFERYMRKLVEDIVERRAAAARGFDNLPASFGHRNIVLTGRILAAIDAPRDHLKFDIRELISNLASCKPGSEPFRLNASAFSATVKGTSPGSIEKVLETIEITEFWDIVGGTDDLRRFLGTKGSRQTGERAKDRLKELCRWRNHLAHGGDEEVALIESQLRDAVTFIDKFSAALDIAVRR